MKRMLRVPLKVTAGLARGAASGLVALALALGGAGCAPAASAPSPEASTTTEPVALTISAASSLKKVLTEQTPAFESASGAKVTFNYGASGQLVKQIEGGAPVDLFLSASPSAVTTLAAEGLASGEASATFAGNTLVVLVPKGNPAGIHGPGDLKKAERLATGDPAVAPHGQKAVEWLTAIGLWDSLSSKFVYAANAAQTDDYIARGEVDAGIGFASDATGRDDIEIAYKVPDGTIKPIKYAGAPISASTQQELAKAYLEFLLSPDVQRAFSEAGFTAVPAK
ncbi:MAG: molybdate ABC transporter substrate-binding protein [Coriobacteriia bacterium]|nr:molybdate ABC transporter substrate-binding protein [Coriobacteriia bacterium]